MFTVPRKSTRTFTPEARVAALAARRAKMSIADDFGAPALFIVRTGASAFSWEVRRFGGVVLQRGPGDLASQDAAKTAGEAVLAALFASPDLPRFERQLVPRHSHQ